ncbi:MAG: YHS domain-containing (seleno)protein [Gemmatimonadota bacterium]|nr:YHS domain-containing (seleno)protein [Gemmatimonadota bacterium]
MWSKNWHSLLALAVTMLLGAAGAAAQQTAYNTDKNGLGLKGYDPVAYFSEGAPVKGTAAFSATYEGVTYRFASAEHRHQFQADPTRYLPQYGGYCAMGVAMGKKLPIDPAAFRIVDGKLYLNVNKSVQRDWLKDVPGHIARADAAWPALKSAPAI